MSVWYNGKDRKYYALFIQDFLFMIVCLSRAEEDFDISLHWCLPYWEFSVRVDDWCILFEAWKSKSFVLYVMFTVKSKTKIVWSNIGKSDWHSCCQCINLVYILCVSNKITIATFLSLALFVAFWVTFFWVKCLF